MRPLPDQVQTAVVTGGARGLGADICRALHRAGFRVVIADLDHGTDAQALAYDLDRAGDMAVTAILDMVTPDDFQDVLDKTIARWGSVKVLVNNAARTAVRPVPKIDPAEFNAVLAVNAGGTFAGSQIFGRHFKERGYNRIINLAFLAAPQASFVTGGCRIG